MKRKEVAGMTYRFQKKAYLIIEEKDSPKVVRDIGIVRQLLVQPENGLGKLADSGIPRRLPSSHQAEREDCIRLPNVERVGLRSPRTPNRHSWPSGVPD